ncbi:MAG: PAC2 family protein [Deltaproteobacteria bacterium]|nr:MAG: PAC2 family protein [Deltaproteobacteria bacterium]
MDTIHYLANPTLREPVMVAAFGGWPNAGEVATSTVNYLVERLEARKLATLAPDDFYLFSLNRPLVTIANGHLKSLDLPQSTFYFWTNSQGTDLILFSGPEPQIRWDSYVELFTQICHRFQVKSFITLGGLHDDVLHYEERVSAAAASMEDVQNLRQLAEPVELTDYVGPSAIHSLFLSQARQLNIQGLSLWAHAASYLQGTNFRLCAAMIKRLNLLLNLDIDTSELELSWRLVEEQIESLIAENEQLSQHVEDLKTREHRGGFTTQTSSSAKVIHLDRFMKQNKSDD